VPKGEWAGREGRLSPVGLLCGATEGPISPRGGEPQALPRQGLREGALFNPVPKDECPGETKVCEFSAQIPIQRADGDGRRTWTGLR